MRRVRGVTAIGLIVAAVVVLAGCGGSSTADTTRAFASAVNLRPGDLVGWFGGSVAEHVEHVAPYGPRVERCAGVTTPRRMAGVASGSLTRAKSAPRAAGSGTPQASARESPAAHAPLETLRSDVFVLPSEAAAGRELAVLSSARLRRCIEREMKAARSVGESESRTGEPGKPTSEPSYKHVEVVLLPTFGPQSFGLRASAENSPFGATGLPTREYEDSLGFVSGRALVVLSTLSVNHPIADATERRLLALLYSRAKAHRL